MAEDRKFLWDEETRCFRNRTSGEAIPDNEPVILFRARDIHALDTLWFYMSQIQDPHHRQAVQDRIDEFSVFRHRHKAAMKEPGITRAIVLNSEIETYCSDCGAPQFDTPSGVSCKNGHGGAEPARPLKLPEEGPVCIMDGKGVYPNNLDRAVGEERHYYKRDQPDPTKRGFTPK